MNQYFFNSNPDKDWNSVTILYITRNSIIQHIYALMDRPSGDLLNIKGNIWVIKYPLKV